jgi:hypothetical protein
MQLLHEANDSPLLPLTRDRERPPVISQTVPDTIEQQRNRGVPFRSEKRALQVRQ